MFYGKHVTTVEYFEPEGGGIRLLRSTTHQEQSSRTLQQFPNQGPAWSRRTNKSLEVKVKFYSFFNLSARWWWVVNATPRPLYSREWIRNPSYRDLSRHAARNSEHPSAYRGKFCPQNGNTDVISPALKIDTLFRSVSWRSFNSNWISLPSTDFFLPRKYFRRYGSSSCRKLF